MSQAETPSGSEKSNDATRFRIFRKISSMTLNNASSPQNQQITPSLLDFFITFLPLTRQKPRCRSQKGLLWGRAGGNPHGGIGPAVRGASWWFFFKDNLKSNLRKQSTVPAPRWSPLMATLARGCPARGQREQHHNWWSHRAAGCLVQASPLLLEPLICPSRTYIHTYICVCINFSIYLEEAPFKPVSIGCPV